MIVYAPPPSAFFMPTGVVAVISAPKPPLVTLMNERLLARPTSMGFAFAVQAGWEDTFDSFPVYAALVHGGGAVVFLAGELLLERLVPPPESSP